MIAIRFSPLCQLLFIFTDCVKSPSILCMSYLVLTFWRINGSKILFPRLFSLFRKTNCPICDDIYEFLHTLFRRVVADSDGVGYVPFCAFIHKNMINYATEIVVHSCCASIFFYKIRIAFLRHILIQKITVF